MQLKKGGMNLSQLQNYFGADNIDADGSFKKSGGGADAFKDDKKLRNYFVNELGRSTSDFDDDVSFDKDVNTAVRSLYSGDSGGEKKENTTPKPLSTTAAKALAYGEAFSDYSSSGDRADFLMGDSPESRQDFMNNYKLNVKERLKSGANYGMNDVGTSNMAKNMLGEKNNK